VRSVIMGIPARYVFAAAAAALLVCARPAAGRDGTIPDGNYLVVRLYDISEAPAGGQPRYQKLQVPFNRYRFHCEYDLAAQAGRSLLVVLPADQNDPNVARLWGNVIFVGRVGPRFEFDLRNLQERRGYEHLRWTFTDALGVPLAGAHVRLYLDALKLPEPCLMDAVLDANGQVQGPALIGSSRQVRLTVEDADLGLLMCRVAWTDSDNRSTVFSMPAAKPGPQADQRSVRGVVLDEQDRPVEGVQVCCEYLLFPGGGRIECTEASRFCVFLTGADGRFSLCPRARFFEQVPAGSIDHLRYRLWVRPPQDLGFEPQYVTVAAGSDIIVRLGQPGLFFHTFVFEDANGPITDEKLLGDMVVRIATDQSRMRGCCCDCIKQGCYLPTGEYRPYVRSRSGRELFFEPVRVDTDSPTELVFRACEASQTRFAGQVLYGFEDRPAAGTLLVVAGLGHNERYTLAMLSDEQWRQLELVGPDTPPDHSNLEPIRRIWDIRKVMRAGPDGTFQFTMRGLEYTDDDYELYAIERGYMPVAVHLYMFGKDGVETVTLPPLRLLPAALAAVQPVDGNEPAGEVHMSWDLEPQWDSWFRKFIEYKNIRGVYFPLHYWISCGCETFKVYVPADIGLRLNFQKFDHNRREWLPPAYTPVIKGGPGELIDLGQIDVGRTMPVFVQVLDPAGEPLPGISVKHGRKVLDGGFRYFGTTKITDANGFAEFQVATCQHAGFFVSCWDRAGRVVFESVDYQTNGIEDANNVYTLQLSEEMKKCLFE